MNITVLAGGVGAGKFLRGLVEVAPPEEITIIGNVADDLETLSLYVCPDLDSVTYALAGLADEERGWGRSDESWRALETVAELGGDSWFRLGDRDLGLHLFRTQLLRSGLPLSEATVRIIRALGIRSTLIPASDDPIRTFIETPDGAVAFQTWFVARQHRDEVLSLDYAGADQANPAPAVVDVIESADLLLITPSNPYTSIFPTLAVPGIRAAIERRSVPCVAVSPIVDGRAVKGPLDRMLRTLAGGTTPAHVAGCYAGLIDSLVIDAADAVNGRAGVPLVVTQTLMHDVDAARRLADVTLGAVA